MCGRRKKWSKPKIQKQSERNIVKSIRNLFKQENEAMKDRTITDIRILFEQEDGYYKPIRGNFWKNNSIEYESNGDRNKNLSVKEYLNKIKPFFEKCNNWSSKICHVKT